MNRPVFSSSEDDGMKINPEEVKERNTKPNVDTEMTAFVLHSRDDPRLSVKGSECP